MIDNNKPVKVSIIVPVYNVEKYIDRCMESLLHQTLDSFEIILVDDGSPDRCGFICDEYSRKYSNVRVVHKQNEGLGYARNSGLKAACGEYVAFADSDDFVDINMYKNMYERAKRESLDAVFAGYSTYRDDNCIVEKPEVKNDTYFRTKEEREKYLLQMIGSEPSYPKDSYFTMSVWRGIYRLDIIQKNQCAFPSEREVVSEDIIFHIQFMNFARAIVVVPQCYYFYCENGASLTHSYRKDRFEKVLKLIERISELFTKYGFCDDQYLYRDRLLLARARGAIRNICNNQDQIGKTESSSAIKAILVNGELKECIQRYPYKKLNSKQRLFFYALKYEWVLGCKLMIAVNDRKK